MDSFNKIIKLQKDIQEAQKNFELYKKNILKTKTEEHTLLVHDIIKEIKKCVAKESHLTIEDDTQKIYVQYTGTNDSIEIDISNILYKHHKFELVYFERGQSILKGIVLCNLKDVDLEACASSDHRVSKSKYSLIVDYTFELSQNTKDAWDRKIKVRYIPNHCIRM